MSDQSDDTNDDLLFYVQRVPDEVQNGGLGVDPVFVKRKVKGGQRVLTPEQEAVVLWKDTFFLNVIVQVRTGADLASPMAFAKGVLLANMAQTKRKRLL